MGQKPSISLLHFLRVPSIVFEVVDKPCQGPFHFSRIADMTFVLSLTQMLVFLSLYDVYVMLSILLSILVCAAASLFCACLVSVQAPYFINLRRETWSTTKNTSKQSYVDKINTIDMD